jgi:hypothetical protein
VPAATLLLCAPLILRLIETDTTMTRGDTRVESLRWFEANVPADERVMIDMLRFWNTASPPLAENRARLEERLGEIARGVSGAGHGAAYAEFYRYRLLHPHAPAYYLRSTLMGDSTGSLAAVRAQGFRWAVVSDDAVRLQRARGRRSDSTGVAFYEALDREATRVAEFRPARWRRLGPTILVYRLDPPAGRKIAVEGEPRGHPRR